MFNLKKNKNICQIWKDVVQEPATKPCTLCKHRTYFLHSLVRFKPSWVSSLAQGRSHGNMIFVCSSNVNALCSENNSGNKCPEKIQRCVLVVYQQKCWTCSGPKANHRPIYQRGSTGRGHDWRPGGIPNDGTRFRQRGRSNSVSGIPGEYSIGDTRGACFAPGFCCVVARAAICCPRYFAITSSRRLR